MTRYLARTAFLLVALMVPMSAWADFMYSFDTSNGQTLFFDTASLLTTTQNFSIPPIPVGNTNFNYVSLTVSGSNECFFLGANDTGDCAGAFGGVPSQFSSGDFTNATSVGSFSATFGSAIGVNVIVLAGPLETLTISQVPEPSSLMLLGSGLLGVMGLSAVFSTRICRIFCFGFLILVCALGLDCVSASGQTTATWTDTFGVWSEAGNWSTNPVVPNNGGGKFYNVVINSPGNVVVLDTTPVINSLSLEAGELVDALTARGSMLTIGDPSFPAAGSLTNNGTITFSQGGNITVGDSSLPAGSLTNHGTINLIFGLIIVNGHLTNSGTMIAGSDDFPFLDNNNFLVSGKLINSGNVSLFGIGNSVSAGSIINSGSMDIGGSFNTLFTTTGGFNNSGGLNVERTNSAFIGGNFNNSGFFSFTGGTTEDGQSPFGAWVVGGAFNNSGTVSSTGPFVNSLFPAGQVDGLFKNSGKVGISFQNVDANGGFSNSGGAVTLNNSVLNVTNGYLQSGAAASTEVADTGVLNTDSYRQNGGGTTIDFGGLLSSTTFKATGGTVSVNGFLVSPAIELDAGSRLQGTGTLTGNVEIGGKIIPGTMASPGTLTINGNYAQTGKGIFDEVISVTSNGLLNVNGGAALGPQSKLEITLVGGINPIGDSLTIMDYHGLVGNFSNGSTFSADGYKWKLNYGSNDAVLTATGLSPTPEPGTFLLFGSGLLGILGAVRKKIIA